MPFSTSPKRKAFIASGGRCAICHEYPIMNYHHINPEAQSQDDSYDNCLPICSNCHGFIQKGEITPEKQRIIRDIWYCNVEWKSTDAEMEYLEKTYVDKNMLEKIDDNVTDIKRQFGEYIGGITTRESWEEVANKASNS